MGFKQKHLLFLVFILGLSALVYYAHWAQQFHFEEEEQSPKIALLFRRLISRLLNYTGMLGHDVCTRSFTTMTSAFYQGTF